MTTAPIPSRTAAMRLSPLLAILLLLASPLAAATFTVVNTNSTGPGSLQQAIFDANTNVGADTITFAITNLSNTIRPAAALPNITEPVTIDGRTQTGFASAPIVEINGASAGAGADGLKIATSNCVVSAVVINNFLGDQIEITNGVNNVVEGCYLGLNLPGTVDASTGQNGVLITNASANIIGGPGSTNRNFISGNNQSGITVGGLSSVSNSIIGNVIGLGVTNAAVANTVDGIRINAPFTFVGGNTSSARNIISGNTSDGIEVSATLGTNAVIRGNWIGTDLNGTLDRGNTADGILVNAGGVMIGGSGSGEGNVISGNNSDGIELTSLSSTNNVVYGNYIGTDFNGTASINNSIHGVFITTSSRSNIIGGVLAGQANIIAFNTQDGVNIAAATANTNNTIRGNSIFSNGTTAAHLGIDLGADGILANDAGDPDTGANQLQNFPVLATVTNTATETIFSGSLNSLPSTTYTVDFYANVASDTGGSGEGQYYLGSTNLTTAADSNVTFTVSLPVSPLLGRYITATATDPFGNTSEFAQNVYAQSTVPGATYTVVNTNDSGAGSLRQAILDANANISAGDTITFAITNLSATISPASALPAITDTVTIDGYTQSGAAANTSTTIFNGTVIVRISGTSAGSGANGLTITHSNCIVRGLNITGFTGSAGDGIEISGSANTIEGCLIGITTNGVAAANAGNGILISSSPNNVIGGTSPGTRNVISGNSSDGVEINGTGAGNQILGNIIGAGLNGTSDVGNSADGVLVTGAGGNIVGGTNSGAGNLISGNNSDGIELTALATTNTVVLGNRIGTDASGTAALANTTYGININTSSRSNVIGGILAGQANIIAFNTQDGVNIAAAVANTNNTIRGNSIFSNGTTAAHLGIDLGADGILANDAGDPDTGANQLQNFPVLSFVTNTPTETIFSGTLNSLPSTTYAIDFYANVSPDTGGNGEGRYYLGSTNLTTAADSNVTFTVSLPVSPLSGRYITATATDPFGNTSEFAANVWAQSTIAGSTYTVINTNDSGAGSLRQAIIDANANVSVGDTIIFAITNLSTTIFPASALPTITDPVTIDGYTQTGAATNTSTTVFNGVVPVRISGGSAGTGANGLTIVTTGNCTVRGVMITGFTGTGADGIEITGGGGNVIVGNIIGLDAAGTDQGNAADGILITGSSNNIVGGNSPGLRNVISGNGGDAIEISGAAAAGNQIIGNIIGLNQAGTIGRANTANGVFVNGAPNTVIGGASSGDRNVISSSGSAGISLSSASATTILGNYIGTEPGGSLDFGNGTDGIFVSGSTNTVIGGASPGAGNLISGNGNDGIEITGVGSSNSIVLGNLIGTAANASTALANGVNGINFSTSARFTQIGGTGAGEANVIAFNLGDGVFVGSGSNHVVRGNSIYSNGDAAGDIGIDLGTTGITANDTGDADTGANQLQNFPVLSLASNSASGTIITGTLNSATNREFALDFYSNLTPDSSGVGQGQTYLGSTNVTTDANGLVNFTAALNVTNLTGRYISATATDTNGNTSEFATNIFAISTVSATTFTVINTNDSGPGSLREAISQANTNISSGDIIAFAITNLSMTIFPASALPAITDPVTIDGYTQPGSSTNSSATAFTGTVLVTLSGASAGSGTDGLRFTVGNNTVRGLAIINFVGTAGDGLDFSGGGTNIVTGNLIGIDQAGVDRGNGGDGIHIVSSPGNIIGGTSPGDRNVISGNTGQGVDISGATSTDNQILGNIIGADLSVSATDLGNGADGILITTAGTNVIGGNISAARNVISWNNGDGIEIATGGSGTLIQNNYIGTDATGTLDFGNSGNGIYINASSNILVAANLISGNNNDGIELNGLSASNNVVQGNLIGSDASGTNSLANNSVGILITSNARFNQIGGVGAANIIAFNLDDGVSVASGTNNPIRANSIYSNGNAANETGIDLGTSGITANDTGDADTGANQLQNFPSLASALNTISGTTVTGTLSSGTNLNYVLDFYSSYSPDSSGSGQGQFYLGSTNVTTDANGLVNFTAALNVTNLQGRYISATATDANGNTSEFATNVFALSTVPGATYVVVNTNDSGAGSLRQAIQFANLSITEDDRIEFNIPGAGPHVIAPASPLPACIDPVTIDGFTQPGASANTLATGSDAVWKIVLDGVNAGSLANGLYLSTGSNAVRGLVIIRHQLAGIQINGNNNLVEGNLIGLDISGVDQGNIGNGVYVIGGTNNLIGGNSPAARNVISGNDNYGVAITGSGTVRNFVKGNYIGTDPTGTNAVGNVAGIAIESPANTVGGLTAAERNVISFNNTGGIILNTISARTNVIQGNFLGTDATGTNAFLSYSASGIAIYSGSFNTIGGSSPGAGNLISGSYGDGVQLANSTCSNNVVDGNFIGTDISGLNNLGNLSYGVEIFNSAHDNFIGNTVGNVIAFNQNDGVFISSGVNNRIRANKIFSNLGIGIDLGTSGVTTNDLNDADNGANNLQNYPVLSAATNSLTQVDIVGSFDGVANTNYALDFFASITADSTGFGEGQFHLGATNVITDGTGHVNFVATFPTTLTGRYVSVTATDPNGNTSEFSYSIAAASTVAPTNIVVTTTNDSGSGSLREAIQIANAYVSSSNDTISFAIPGAGPHTITPVSALPDIVDGVTIDGYTQTGASANTLCTSNNAVIQIRLLGTSAGFVDGLVLSGTGSSIIRGLSIVGFGSDGITMSAATGHRVEGCFIGLSTDGTTIIANGGNGVLVASASSSGNTIGGSTAAARNLISGNSFSGVFISNSTSNTVSGNLIGTDRTGAFDRGNSTCGVTLSGSTAIGNVIGGLTACERNVLSGNGNFTFSDHFGVNIVNGRSNTVAGNFIGLGADGAQIVGNGSSGVRLSGASFNTIGGSTAAERNIISGNSSSGVELELTSPTNTVSGNYIGTDATGLLDRGNNIFGVLIAGASYNTVRSNVISGNNNDALYVAGNASPGNRIIANFIGVDATGTNALANSGTGVRIEQSNTQVGGTNSNEGNTIAFNLDRGVYVSSGDINCPILGNSIYSNSNLGIDLNVNGVTANDTGDADTGGNNLQNYPVLQFALSDTNNTWAIGSLDSGTNQTYRIEFFDNASLDPTGYGEGQRFSAATNVTTDANGHADFIVYLNPPPIGNYVTSTATDTNGNTSEFSAGSRVVAFDSVDLQVALADSSDPASSTLGFSYSITVTNRGPTNATGVVVTDTLPPGVNFVSASSSQGTVTNSGNVVTCDLGALNYTSNATITINVTASQHGLVSNTVVVSTTPSDNDTSNNADTETTFIGIANIGVTIVDSPDPVVAGQVLTNIVTVTNLGPDSATLASLSFDVDSSAIPVSFSTSQGSVIQSGNNFALNAGTILAGAAATLTVNAIPTSSGIINHFASVAALEQDLVVTNNNVNESTTVTNGAGILQFLGAQFSVNEGGGQAFITVLRTGGTIGSVAAQFATANGSATAGADYSNTVGTVSFLNGENIKTVTVPLINDTAFECNEFFNIALHSPTGGVVLIGTTQAVVNIIENDINAAGNVFIASGSSNLLDGVAGNNNSYESSVSADGRYVTFSSDARNLVDNDFNFNTDVFVRDLITQSTRLVSVNQFGGVSGNDSSYSAQISGDGRYVLFASSAADLAADDANSALDVFQRDLFLETTTLISRHFTGTNSANNSSYTADQNRSLMSSNGQVAVFTSYADDLVNAPDSNFDNDVFLYDASTGTNRLISINAAGTDAGASYSIDPVVSADGQIVAFTSYASDLVADDFNDTEDVFIRDVAAGTTELVSINLIGSGSANAQSGMAFLSADGRFVAFESSATDLATNDVTFAQDVYWRDRQSGTTVLVSVNTNGAAAGNNTSTVNGISADGRYVVFSSYANNLVTNDSNFSQDVFVRDMWSNTTVLVSVNLAGNASANSDSFNAVISGDGTGVSFESYATDLTAQTKFGFNTDVFVRDLVTGTTRLVSYRNGSTNAPDASSYDPAINFNGDVTSFTGDPESGGGGGEGLAIVVNGGQYMDVWAHTWPSNTTELVSVSSPSASGSSYSYGAVVSRDGQWAAFVSNASNLATNDLNNTEDVYLINLNTFAIRLLSTNLSGVAANDYSSNPSISSNGNYIAFDSVASDLTANDGNFNQDVFVHDRLTGSNILVSVNLTGTDTGNGYSAFPSISPDGRYVAFESDANNLTTNGTSFNRDIFLRDLQTGNTRLISHNVAGNSGGDASSFGAGIEVDPVSGKIYVVYTSYAGNLVNNDTNLTQDVFLYDVAAGSNHLVSVNSSGTGSGNGFSYNPRLAVNSASSNVFVTFISTAGNLVNNDTNGFEDVFLFDLKSKTNRLVSVNQSGTISGNGYSILPSISADGRYVAFQSFATDLVTGDTNSIEDIFLRDTVSGSTTLITKTCDGTSSADGFSHDAVVSADGRYITYLSAAMNHVPGNFFGTDNVFRYDRVLDTSVLISQNRFLTGGANGPSYNPQISGDGSVILFSSLATDLVADDANSEEDVFIWKAGTVATAVDLVMNKSASSPTVGEYFNFTYTLAVTNFGTLAASGVSVTDTLPAGVSFVSAVTTQGTVTNSGNTVTASVGNLGVTAGAQITITVTATNAGVVNNIASTTAVESDATPGNNSDNAVVTITPLTPPTLTITPTNASQLLITWPSSTPNVFVAQTTTNLIPVIVWSNLTNAITDNGSVKFILLNVNIGEPERYYRLKK